MTAESAQPGKHYHVWGLGTGCMTANTGLFGIIYYYDGWIQCYYSLTIHVCDKLLSM